MISTKLGTLSWGVAAVWSIFSKTWSASSVRKVPLPTRRRTRPWRSIICSAERTAVRLVLSCRAMSRSLGSLAPGTM